MKRHFFFLFLAVALMLPAACSSGGSSHSSAKTLSFFDWDSFQNPTGKQLIQEYEKSHPGTTIQVARMPPGDPFPYVSAQLSGGTASDLMTLAANEQPWKDIKKNWWLDLTPYANARDPYVPGNKKWLDLLTPGAQKLLPFSNGKIYSMSTTGFDVAFFYNKDVFAKLNLAPPTTWSQMVDEFTKMKAAGYIPLEFELGDHEYAGQAPAFITILEGTLMRDSITKMDTNSDGVIDVQEMVDGIRNGTYSANNADYQESWKLLKSLSPYFQLAPSSAKNSEQGLNAFKTGKVATWFEGSFNSSSLASTNIKWGVFQMPRVGPETSAMGTTSAYPTGSFGACCGYPWEIPVSTQKNGKVKMAVDFLYWLSKPENTQRFADGSGVLSMEKQAKTPADLKPFAEAAANVSPVATGELSLPPEFLQTRARLVEEYVIGSLSLSDAMQQMQQAMDTAASDATDLYGLK
jgi:ABC-type glycerol-3-phosphate transport system substrate-binding protein